MCLGYTALEVLEPLGDGRLSDIESLWVEKENEDPVRTEANDKFRNDKTRAKQTTFL